MILDDECLILIDGNPNLLVPWYLLASYAYYQQDDPILTDSFFDRMAKKLLKDWDTIEHVHKGYLNQDMLEAGTYSGDYPPQVEGGLNQLRDVYKNQPKKKVIFRKTNLESMMG
jgi:hypothetical protein